MAAPSPMPAVALSPKEKHAMLDRPKSITFKEKLFYLDLPHNKSTQFLTKAICRLGGVIEGFLSRDVNYVVTGSRKALDNVNGSSVTSRRGGHCKRQAAENVEPALCRGKQLLKKAIQNQERSNVLANAHSWGVCILQVDEVLEHFTHSASKTAVEKGGAKGVKTVKVAKLKSPFLKIEDQSRKYRPLQCCFSSFPEISFISSGRSPFETAHTNNSTPKEKDAGDQDDGERSPRPHTREKSGFCECCRVAYTKLSEHLISEQHSQFSLDNSNYKVIDDIASNMMCDLMEYPCGIMPVMEGVVADGPFNIEDTQVPVLKESKMVVHEVLCEGNSAVTPVEENYAAHVSEEHMPDIVQRQPVKNASPSEWEENMDVTKNDGDPVECNGQINTFAEDTNNSLIQCKGQLQEICGVEVASHVDLVTEVSWYTEEAGLTSVYTVQSLVIPPDGQHAQMTMANAVATFSPPLLLSPLADTQGDLGPECPCEAHNPSVLQDSLPGTQVSNNDGAHCSELLVEQMSVLEVGEQLQGIAEPSAGNLCGVHLLDAFLQLPAGERRPEEMVNVQLGSIRLHEQLLSVDQNDPLINASASLPTPVDRALCQEHLNVIPLYEGPADTLVVNPPSSTLLTKNSDREDQLVHGLVDTSGTIPSGNEASAPEQTLDVITLSHHPADVVHNTTPLDKASAPQNNRLNVMPLHQGSAVTHSSRPSVNEASTPEQSELQSTTDFCRGKRKHSCSSPPPAKRRSYQCKPLSLPAWAFHQLPNSGLEHVANDLPNKKKSKKKFVTNEDTVDSLNHYFNPKLIQYNASSESDWDSGLLSQQQCKHQQGAQLGDLRTAQVNLDESWYGRELGSVLAQDQSLGSHSTTQTVTLAQYIL
ncbi:protein DBF4 homolog B isoform X2 [Rana temporaria]|uniref:protein DBF4 homolog B isoform X2 n=1 Tax=Rana temporaria TaxID=8407 RepID=UPI001AAD112E|nr:protein DBF4 homolog B isoform X2 [Rana temporaria]